MSPTTSTYERGLKVTAVAPINLNPKLDKLLKLNQAYITNKSKLEGSQYLDDTIQTVRGSPNKKKQDLENQDALNR
jgi:hypothetical protein